LTSDVP